MLQEIKITTKTSTVGSLSNKQLTFQIKDKFINPLLPIADKSARIGKISILKLEGIIKKFSYERRDYESVDEKSLSKGTKGLNLLQNLSEYMI